MYSPTSDSSLATAERPSTSVDGPVWWKSTWPLAKPQWLQLLGALLAVITVTSIIGELLTNWAAPNGLVDLDREIASDLAANRTETKNDLAHWGAFIADTPVKIGASVLVVGAMLWRWRRWHEAVFVGLTLIFEAAAYATSSTIIGRERPDVERLLDSPVPTSFPSGHVAAATVYLAMVIVLFWRTRNVWARSLALLVGLAAPLAVAWARMYQGMHFLSDVVAGVILGLVSIVICLRILGTPDDALAVGSQTTAPANPQ